MKTTQTNNKKILVNLATLKSIDIAIDKVEFYSNQLNIMIKQIKLQRKKAEEESVATENN